MGLGQVHLAKTWEWSVAKNDNTLGEQILSPSLPSYKKKDFGQWPDLKTRYTQGSQNGYFITVYANKHSLYNKKFL